MAIVRFSTGYRNARAAIGSTKLLLTGGALYGYNGSQPSSADNAPTGTNLIIFTEGGGARTTETCAAGTVTLTGGASGSVNSITVGGVEVLKSTPFASATVVNFDTSLTVTAAAVATQINLGTYWHGWVGSSSGAIITITKVPGFGTAANSLTVTSTCTTITKTDANTSGGVSPVNGFEFGAAASGEISKTSDVWSGLGLAEGNITWVRYVGPSSSPDGASTQQIRLDMDASTAAAFFQMSSTAIAVDALVTINTAAFYQQSVVTG